MRVLIKWLIPRPFQYGLELLSYWFIGYIYWRAHVCSAPHRERAFLMYLSLLVQAPFVNEWWMAGNIISGLVEHWPAFTALNATREWPLLWPWWRWQCPFPVSLVLTLHLYGQMGLIPTLLETNNANSSLGPAFFGLGILSLFWNFSSTCSALSWGE